MKISIIVTLSLFFIFYVSGSFIRAFNDIGTHDFLGYWAAFQALYAGFHQFDFYEVLKIHQSIDSAISSPLMLWAPPWVLTVLYPILQLDFLFGARVWLVVNLALYSFIVSLIFKYKKLAKMPTAN